MKNYLLLIALCFPLFYSCTKTKYVSATFRDTVRITLHDTTRDTLYKRNTIALMGQWRNGSETMEFDKYYATKNGNSLYLYINSPDTIYSYHHDLSVSPEYGYTISATNDTLTLYPVTLSPAAPYVYYRY